MMEKKKKFRIRPMDIVFWVLILLLIIPSTRSVFLEGFSKVRTALFTPALKATDGPVLTDPSWNWPLTGLDGKTVLFSEFRGEVILVNSWATWCPPCRAEMPSLEKLYESYGSRIKMVLVTQEEPGVVREYIDKKAYLSPVYLSSSAFPQAFSSRSLPTTYILDRSGKVVYQRTGAFDWNHAKVKNFLDKLLTE